MATFRCKMCGGSIDVPEGQSSYTCEYCGTQQTIPTLKDENLQALFNRANVLRMKSEFDKAADIYEKILQADQQEAEAYWGLILCKFGIEYVEDPKTYKRIPTCHRASYESVTADEDYKSALTYADVIQRGIYEAQAKEIDEIQHGIIALAQKEDPYDVFICYKETDENGNRTSDSVIANDIYYQLTREGYKVFYSAITLEDKLGSEYEPYIFSALNTAKVMLAIGTKPEYFTAVWVKNEWSRFLKIMKKDRSKLLIPCYRDMDPYELPEEFAHLQAQDMGKIGFIQDLIRGIKKVIVSDEPKPAAKETIVVSSGNTNIEPLLRRAFLFLEDGDWAKADDFCEQVLNLDPENAKAYVGKLMAELHVRREEDLANCSVPFNSNNNYQKALRFGDDTITAMLSGYIAQINERNENERQTKIYNDAVSAMKSADSEASYQSVATAFKTIPGFKDADMLVEKCLKRAEEEKEKILSLVYAIKEGRKIKTLEKKLSEARTKVEDIERIRNLFKDAQVEISSVQDAINDIDAQIKQLSERKSRLGIFAGKEKKQIDGEVGILKSKKTNLISQLDHWQRKYENYYEAMGTDDIDSVRKSAAELEVQIKEAQDDSDMQYSYEDAIHICLRSPDVVASVRKNAPEIGIIIALQDNRIPIFFGTYGQKKVGEPEPIEWIVLAKEKSRILVISKYALDCQPYNTSFTDVTWETCSLRKWLNESFINTAFNSNERNLIQSAFVIADKNPSWDTDPGKSTTDKVFLLSINEASRYFSTDLLRQCAPTDWAITQGCSLEEERKVDGRSACWWWLRSPGNDSNNAADVEADGFVNDYGSNVDIEYGGVRPALWIDLGS